MIAFSISSEQQSWTSSIRIRSYVVELFLKSKIVETFILQISSWLNPVNARSLRALVYVTKHTVPFGWSIKNLLLYEVKW